MKAAPKKEWDWLNWVDERGSKVESYVLTLQFAMSLVGHCGWPPISVYKNHSMNRMHIAALSTRTALSGARKNSFIEGAFGASPRLPDWSIPLSLAGHWVSW